MPHSDPLRICLDRQTELPATVLAWRDWPGYAGPLVVLGAADLAPRLACLAPRFRLIQLNLNTTRPYQSLACDVAEFLHLYGATDAVLLGHGVGAVIVQLTASWFADTVRGVLLLDPSTTSDGLLGQSLRDAPPDLASLAIEPRVEKLVALDPRQVEALMLELSAC